MKRFLAEILTGTVLFTALGANVVLAQTNDAKTIAKVRAKVAETGASRTKVEVKLRNQTKLKGHISNVGADDFTVTDAKTGASQTVAYADVEKVSKGGSGLTLGTWILIASGAAAAITLGAVFHSIRCNESGC